MFWRLFKQLALVVWVPDARATSRIGTELRCGMPHINFPLTNERLSRKQIRRDAGSISGNLTCRTLKVSNEKYHYNFKSLWIALQSSRMIITAFSSISYCHSTCFVHWIFSWFLCGWMPFAACEVRNSKKKLLFSF
jgi:hypothetical protein